jgi:hypothetical protein
MIVNDFLCAERDTTCTEKPDTKNIASVFTTPTKATSSKQMQLTPGKQSLAHRQILSPRRTPQRDCQQRSVLSPVKCTQNVTPHKRSVTPQKLSFGPLKGCEKEDIDSKLRSPRRDGIVKVALSERDLSEKILSIQRSPLKLITSCLQSPAKAKNNHFQSPVKVSDFHLDQSPVRAVSQSPKNTPRKGNEENFVLSSPNKAVARLQFTKPDGMYWLILSTFFFLFYFHF